MCQALGSWITHSKSIRAWNYPHFTERKKVRFRGVKKPPKATQPDDSAAQAWTQPWDRKQWAALYTVVSKEFNE